MKNWYHRTENGQGARGHPGHEKFFLRVFNLSFSLSKKWEKFEKMKAIHGNVIIFNFNFLITKGN